LRRNISKFPEEIKKRAYQAIVRANVEYASSAWDPDQENQIKKIEMVQRRSARFIKHQYSREPVSVTNIQKCTCTKRIKITNIGNQTKNKKAMLVSQSFSSSNSDKHPRLYKTTKQDNQAISPTEIQKCTDIQ
jgi:uncharacterized protein YchJ